MFHMNVPVDGFQNVAENSTPAVLSVTKEYQNKYLCFCFCIGKKVSLKWFLKIPALILSRPTMTI